MFSWVAENWVTIMAVFGGVQAVARVTPTTKDDEITSRIGKALNFLFSATNNSRGR